MGADVIMLIVGLLALTGVLAAWPDTPTVKRLRRWLVEAPVRRMNRISRSRVVAWLIITAAIAVAFLLFQAEGLRLAAMAAPELMTWLTLFDIATLAEGMAAVAVLAATRRWTALKVAIRGAVSSLTALFRRLAGRTRENRPPAARRRRPCRRDDPDPFGWAQAVSG